MVSGFSQQNSIKKGNQNLDIIIYQRFVKDHMLANNIKPSTIKVTNKMLIIVKGARSRYDEERKETKKNDQVTVKERN